jgi:NAD(P)-dependent dehydrogenase (short-subunit alcohol dehydrogenase family)
MALRDVPRNSSPTPGTVLLTGPTGGLGQALLGPLARRKPTHLVLLGRDPVALEAAAQVARDVGAPAVTVVQADLADLNSVARAGRDVSELVQAGAPPLSAMVLNAGIQMADRRHTSAQGIELTFAVNVVAQHLLLSTTVAATAPGAHSVLVGSGTHFGDWHSYGMVPPPQWQDPTLLAQPDTEPIGRGAGHLRRSGPRAYATSKLAVLHLAHAWQARQGDRRFNVFDPGLMPGTGLGRQLTGGQLWAWNHVMPALTFLPGWSTPRRSGEHLAALALGEVHGDLLGGYVEIDKVRHSSPMSYDLAHQERLWEELHALATPYTSGPLDQRRGEHSR